LRRFSLFLISFLMLLHQPLSAKSLWYFDGSCAVELQELLSNRYQDQLQGHIFAESEIEEFLQNTAKYPSQWGCLDDSDTCMSPERSLLIGMKVKEKILGFCEQKNGQYLIKLNWEKLQPYAQNTYVGENNTLEEALNLALEQTVNIGYLLLKNLPKDAIVKIDDVEVGKGDGKYTITVGSHQLSISAENFKTYENQIDIKKKEILELNLSLDSAFTRLIFKIKPEDAEVFIDGEKVDPQQIKNFNIQKTTSFRVQVIAPEYQTFDEQITLNPEEEATLRVNLPSNRPIWKTEASKAHPDLFAKPQRTGLKLSLGTMNSGAWPAQTTINRRVYDVTKQLTPLNSFGFETNVNADLGPVSSELIGFSFITSSDQVKVKIKDGRDSSMLLDGLNKFNLRLLWFGYQFPAWRLAPFIRAGFILTYEWSQILKGTAYQDAMDLNGTSASGAKVSYFGIKMGWELGLRIQASPDWHAQISWSAETWFGVRSFVQTSILVGYALDLFKF
jgi:hypothetical protein